MLAQRLVRSICEKCKESYAVEPATLEKLGITSKNAVFYHGKGCGECKNTGYSKRIGIFEMLIIDESIRRLIISRASAREIKNAAVKNNMILMRADGIQKAMRGMTTIAEVMKATQEED